MVNLGVGHECVGAQKYFRRFSTMLSTGIVENGDKGCCTDRSGYD